MRNYIVYKLTLTDGRVYIGMTHQPLFQRCRSSGYVGCPSMKRAIEEFGWDAFSVSVIADCLSQSEAEQVERENISLYDSTNPAKGFNVALGGNIKGRHSCVTRQKMSENQKGRVFSKTHLSKLRKPKMNGALRRTVLQFDMNGDFLREFPSFVEAAESIQGRKECVIRCCNHKQRYHKGFIWKYGNEVKAND